ncbi:CGNR zinc finger domain-containing protein [Amycolatopsis kentuckyensis]|uniref:CGNR zinc finger domain-containing protein n=1 Tax=Amycolatopsis kentuckyensis TaxID=218823 RepID=UPI000A386C6B|nr:CGNR zinc finger domain-containing protein [Amycolatopsis kentuckyensis]
MTWLATARYGPHPAPGGLGFVQDLLNTRSAGRPRQPDLLADVTSAQDWADGALAAWTEETGQDISAVVLGEGDLDPLRDLRVDLHAHVGGSTRAAEHQAGVVLRLDPDGRVRPEPRGTGWRALASLALIAIADAQSADTWRRLKTCRNPRCEAAFFDRSRNNSGTWHDVRVCGNPANLRAYRARQRSENN